MLQGIRPVPHLADPGGSPEKFGCCDPGENKSMAIIFGSFWLRLTSAKSSPLLTVTYILLHISGSPGWQTMIFVYVKSKLDLHIFSRHTRVSRQAPLWDFDQSFDGDDDGGVCSVGGKSFSSTSATVAIIRCRLSSGTLSQ